MKRRSLLALGGSAVTASVAGCLDYVPTVGETTLGRVWIANFHEEQGHGFDVRIERDGTVVHRGSHQLAADDPSVQGVPQVEITCGWDLLAGDYTVFVRSDEREWQRFDPLEGAVRPPDCVEVEIHYGDDFGPSDDPPKFTFGVEAECPVSECPQSGGARG